MPISVPVPGGSSSPENFHLSDRELSSTPTFKALFRSKQRRGGAAAGRQWPGGGVTFQFSAGDPGGAQRPGRTLPLAALRRSRHRAAQH